MHGANGPDTLSVRVGLSAPAPLSGVFTPSHEFRVPRFDQLAHNRTRDATHQIFVTDDLAVEPATQILGAAIQLSCDLRDWIELFGHFISLT